MNNNQIIWGIIPEEKSSKTPDQLLDEKQITYYQYLQLKNFIV